MELGKELLLLGHASFLLRHSGKNIYLDPFMLPPTATKADLIIITHGHFYFCLVPRNCQTGLPGKERATYANWRTSAIMSTMTKPRYASTAMFLGSFRGSSATEWLMIKPSTNAAL